MPGPRYEELAVGAQLPEREFPVDRGDLVRYAGASGDFNEIHWNERIAREVDLPNVIAHGMLTMAKAIQLVTDWTGDPGSVVEYSVRFTRPVIVPDDGAGAVVSVSGKIGALLGDNKARIDLTAISDGTKVLGKAVAVVRLP
jgi:acyl dehydratase